MNVTTETLYKTWRVLFQCSGSFTFTYCVLTITTDIGLAAHRLCHVVQPAADLSGSVQLPHQLPAAQVLEGVCSGGGRAYWIIQRETRQRTCPEEPSEFLQPETSWTHHHPFQQRLGEDLCPLQIQHQKTVLQHLAPLCGDLPGGWRRVDEDGFHCVKRVCWRSPSCSSICRWLHVSSVRSADVWITMISSLNYTQCRHGS